MHMRGLQKKSKDMTEYNIFGLFCRLICGIARYYTFVKGHCKKNEKTLLEPSWKLG